MADQPGILRFGVFEVNLTTGELRKNGARLKLQEQPFCVLVALLERRGEVVTKEELKERLWAGDTFVDFDHSLSTAVNKIREALGDSASSPRFIETVPKRGYRFIAPVPPRGQPVSDHPSWRSVIAKPLALVGLGCLGVGLAILTFWSRRNTDDTARFEFLPPKPFTSEMGYELSPSFSPDGNQIVFTWDGPARRNFDLYTKLIGASSRLQLTDTDDNEYSPAWSPDGLSIAFARDASPGRLGIFVMPAIGGAERFVAEISSDRLGTRANTGISLMFYPTLSWTPDGEWLLTADRESEVGDFNPILISVKSGERQGFGTDIQGRTAAISPNGSMLAFVSRHMFYFPLAEGFEPTAKPTNLTNFTMWLGRPAWTPDGNSLLVTGVPDDESLSVVRQVFLDGSEPRRILELGDQVAQQTISRNGRLAFVRRMNDHNIWLAQLSVPTHSDKVTRLIASTFTDLNPEFSRDGSKIVFVSTRSGHDEIWVCDRDGTNPVQVTHSGEHGVGSPTWSPDGRYIAFDGYAEPEAPLTTTRPYHDWEILVVRSDGGEFRRLTSGGGVLPAWSPSGEWIYYTHIRSTPRNLYRVRADGGMRELVAENAAGATLSPDGEWIYFHRDQQIWRKPTRGGDEEVVIEEHSGPFAVTDSGVYFQPAVSEKNQSSIAYLDLETRKTTTIYETPQRLFAWMAVSADGGKLLFNQLDQEGSDIMLVDDFWR